MTVQDSISAAKRPVRRSAQVRDDPVRPTAQFHPRFSFNAVLTPASHDVNAIIDWFQDYFPGCNVGFEGVVHSYASDPASIFSIEQLAVQRHAVAPAG
jgi:hypothetical protein